MVNTVRTYDDAYNYGSVTHKRKSKQFNKFCLTIGSVLIGLSFFIPYFLSDQDGNGAITAITWVVSVVLFKQIEWRKLFL
jgi:hypothetical protein